jgi:hypothetical protein
MFTFSSRRKGKMAFISIPPHYPFKLRLGFHFVIDDLRNENNMQRNTHDNKNFLLKIKNKETVDPKR